MCLLLFVHIASHLDSNDNHVVRLIHFLNNELIHAVRPGYHVYWDVSTFVVFADQATTCHTDFTCNVKAHVTLQLLFYLLPIANAVHHAKLHPPHSRY